MKHNKFFIFMPLLFTVLLMIAFPYVVHADNTVQSLVVKAIIPENQKAEVNGYFDLLVKSGEKQTVYVQITNNKEENIVVTLVPANAYTRPGGGIFYDTAINSPDITLLDQSFALSDHISVEKEVAIKGNQTVDVPIEITVPDMQNGSVLGGLMISEKAPANEAVKENTKSNEAKFKVLTKTVFSIAIQLDFPKEATPDLSFGKAGFHSDGAKVYIEIRNDAPMIQKEISGTYKVTGEDGKELFEGKIAPIIMAPKTQINYPVPWNAPTIESGNYTLSVLANVAGKKINVDRNFIIDENEVAKYSEKANQPTAKLQTVPRNLLYWIIAAVVLICIGFIFWFVKKKRNLTQSQGNSPKHFIK